MKALTIKIIISLFLFIPLSAYSDEIIKGNYCYTYGDNESLKEAKELVHTLAVRNAIESYRTYLISTSEVKNFALTNDLLQIISSGYLKNIKEIESTINGRTVCKTIQATLSPQQIEKAIKNIVQKRVKGIEEKGIASNRYIKILSVGEDRYGYSIIIQAKILKKVMSDNENLCVFIGFYDENGDETETRRSCAVTEVKYHNYDPMKNPHGYLHQWLYPGEIKSHKIEVPENMRTLEITKKWSTPPYKLWLLNEEQTVSENEWIPDKPKRSKKRNLR